MSAETFLLDLFWVPAYSDCVYCSTRTEQVPAVYELWFTTAGMMVTDEYPPMSCLHTTCVDCTANARDHQREPGAENMRLVVCRDLIAERML